MKRALKSHAAPNWLHINQIKINLNISTGQDVGVPRAATFGRHSAAACALGKLKAYTAAGYKAMMEAPWEMLKPDVA